jgi:hypothetical protein
VLITINFFVLSPISLLSCNTSDELFHLGEPFLVLEIDPQTYRIHRTIMGPELLGSSSMEVQHTIRRESWFGCFLLSAYHYANSHNFALPRPAPPASQPDKYDEAPPLSRIVVSPTKAPFSFAAPSLNMSDGSAPLDRIVKDCRSLGFALIGTTVAPAFSYDLFTICSGLERTEFERELPKANPELSTAEIHWILDQLCPFAPC